MFSFSFFNPTIRQLGPVSLYLFNGYCGPLDGFFTQMVEYGILNPEDAQCFSVQGSIEPGSFTLVASAILLALLNSFVTKATRQYNYFEKRRRLQEEINNEHNNNNNDAVDSEKNSSSTSTHDDKNVDNDAKKISTSAATSSLSSIELRPIPVMFTDTYRWLLVRGQGSIEEVRRGSSSSTTEGKESSPPLSATL